MTCGCHAASSWRSLFPSSRARIVLPIRAGPAAYHVEKWVRAATHGWGSWRAGNGDGRCGGMVCVSLRSRAKQGELKLGLGYETRAAFVLDRRKGLAGYVAQLAPTCCAGRHNSHTTRLAPRSLMSGTARLKSPVPAQASTIQMHPSRLALRWRLLSGLWRSRHTKAFRLGQPSV